jgi:hypothetical protein
VGIPPPVVFTQARKVSVGNVNSAHESHPTIDYDNFPVQAKVDFIAKA